MLIYRTYFYKGQGTNPKEEEEVKEKSSFKLNFIPFHGTSMQRRSYQTALISFSEPREEAINLP